MEHVYSTLAVPCEKSKMISLTSSMIKNINLLLSRFLYF